MADARLGILLDAKNNASAAISQVNGQLQNLGRTAQNINAGGVGGLNSALAGLAGGVGSALAGIGIGIGAIKTGEAVVELSRLAIQADVVRESFDQLSAGAGQSSDALLDALQQASGGAIANSNLILAANRAMLLGVADSADEMSQLMQVALARGRAMGLSAEQAFSDIVTGIGRMSPLILDNLGIVTGGEKVFDEYAAALGRTAESLTDVERKQALVNSVISSSRSIVAGMKAPVDDGALALQRYDAAMQNLRVSVGQAFAPAVIASANALVDAINRVGENAASMQFGDATAQRWGIEGLDVSPEAIDWRGQTAGIRAEMESLAETIEVMRGRLNVTFDDAGIAAINEAVAEAEARYAELQAALDAVSADVGNFSESYWQVVEALNEGESAARSNAEAASFNAEATRGIVTAAQQAQQSISSLSAEEQANVAQLNALGVSASIASGQLSALGAVALSQVSAFQTLEQAVAGLQMRLAGVQPVLSGLEGMRAGALAEVEQAAMRAVESGANPDAIAQMYEQAAGAIQDAALSFDATAAAQFKNKIAIDQVAQSYLSQIGAVQSALDSNAQMADSYNRLGETAQSTAARIATGLVPSLGTDAALARNEELARGTQTQIDAWVQAGYSVEQIESVLLPSYLDQLREANTLTAAHGSAVDAVGQSYDDLKGKVQGVLSGSLDTGVGFTAEDLLPREDAINENARRLADIAKNGLSGQSWLEEFKAEVPAVFAEIADSPDPKIAATKLLHQFEQGLRPELIDKDKVKDTVRAMILGKQAMAGLADEIAAELATEMGIGIEKAKQAVGSAVGLPSIEPSEPVSIQVAPPAPVTIPIVYQSPESATIPSPEPVTITMIWGSAPEWTPPTLPVVTIVTEWATPPAWQPPDIAPVTIVTEWATPATWQPPTLPTLGIDTEWWPTPEWTPPTIAPVIVTTEWSVSEVPVLPDLPVVAAQVAWSETPTWQPPELPTIGIDTEWWPTPTWIPPILPTVMIDTAWNPTPEWTPPQPGEREANGGAAWLPDVSQEWQPPTLPSVVATVTLEADTVGFVGTLAESVLAGIDGENVGAAAAEKISAQLSASSSLEGLAQAGRRAGRSWGDAFLSVVGDNVPEALIDMLVSLISPEIQAQQAQQATMTEGQ